MIRGDSSEYELLKEWVNTLPFFSESPAKVLTCEIGVREGLFNFFKSFNVCFLLSKAKINNGTWLLKPSYASPVVLIDINILILSILRDT